MFDNYPDYEYDVARFQLVWFMLGMGANLTLGDFAQIAQDRGKFLIALLCHLVVAPLVALAIIYLAQLETDIAVGLILTAAMPGGALSKFFTYLARGNVALSISLTGVTTLATLVVVPLLVRGVAARFLPDDFTMPTGAIITDVLLCLLAPAVAGMLIARWLPRHRRVISKVCLRIGLCCVVYMVVGSLASGRIRVGQYGFFVPFLIVVFCLLTQQFSVLVPRLLRWPKRDCASVAVEATMRNMNLALVIYASLFRGNHELGAGVLFVVLFYAAVAMVAGLPVVVRYRLTTPAAVPVPRVSGN